MLANPNPEFNRKTRDQRNVHVALRCSFICVVVGLTVAVPILGVDVCRRCPKVAAISERMLNLMSSIGSDSYISARADAVAAMARSKALPAIH
jgi:hypothetical protein